MSAEDCMIAADSAYTEAVAERKTFDKDVIKMAQENFGKISLIGEFIKIV